MVFLLYGWLFCNFARVAIVAALCGEVWSIKRLHQGFACITSYAWPNVSNVAYLAVTRLCCQCNLRLHSTSNVEFRTDGFGTAWTVNPLSKSVRMALAHLDVHQLSRNYQRGNRFVVLMEAYGCLWLLGVQLKLFFPYQSVTSARRCTIVVITSVIGRVCFILIYICASSAQQLYCCPSRATISPLRCTQQFSGNVRSYTNEAMKVLRL